jgi:hypothetical protein
VGRTKRLETFRVSSHKKGKYLRRQRKLTRRKAIIILCYVVLREQFVNNRICKICYVALLSDFANNLIYDYTLRGTAGKLCQ